MTIEEAKAIIKGRYTMFCNSIGDCIEWDSNFSDALGVVIQALEQEPCEDCISRKASIDAIQNKAKRLTNEDTINGLCGAVAILFDLPLVTPQEPRWIPISERLPEPDVEVLVTDDAGGLATISTDSIYESETTGEKEWYTSQRVTAWMPLPKPYKAESEVEDGSSTDNNIK